MLVSCFFANRSVFAIFKNLPRKGEGPDEETLVKTYLSLLEEEDINQLVEIYR